MTQKISALYATTILWIDTKFRGTIFTKELDFVLFKNIWRKKSFPPYIIEKHQLLYNRLNPLTNLRLEALVRDRESRCAVGR